MQPVHVALWLGPSSRGGRRGEVTGDFPSLPGTLCRNAFRNDQETSGMYNGGEGGQMTAQTKAKSGRTTWDATDTRHPKR
jgi:hypothetical protein